MLLFVFLDHIRSQLKFDQDANGSLLSAGRTETEILVCSAADCGESWMPVFPAIWGFWNHCLWNVSINILDVLWKYSDLPTKFNLQRTLRPWVALQKQLVFLNTNKRLTGDRTSVWPLPPSLGVGPIGYDPYRAQPFSDFKSLKNIYHSPSQLERQSAIEVCQGCDCELYVLSLWALTALMTEAGCCSVCSKVKPNRKHACAWVCMCTHTRVRAHTHTHI